MDCIPYINDLDIEIQTLKKINSSDPKIMETIKEKETLLKLCKENLEKLSNKSIECRLYLAMLGGLSSAQAVKKIAEENYFSNKKPCSINGIWNYYLKLQKILQKK